jgi:flagellar protein FlgJ
MELLSVNKPVGVEVVKTQTGTVTDIERKKKLKKICADFESVLVYQLFKTMRQTIPKDGTLGASHGKETYEMMLDQKLADDLATKGQGLGLQKMLYNQLTRQIQNKD